MGSNGAQPGIILSLPLRRTPALLYRLGTARKLEAPGTAQYLAPKVRLVSVLGGHSAPKYTSVPTAHGNRTSMINQAAQRMIRSIVSGLLRAPCPMHKVAQAYHMVVLCQPLSAYKPARARVHQCTWRYPLAHDVPLVTQVTHSHPGWLAVRRGGTSTTCSPTECAPTMWYWPLAAYPRPHAWPVPHAHACIHHAMYGDVIVQGVGGWGLCQELGRTLIFSITFLRQDGTSSMLHMVALLC